MRNDADFEVLMQISDDTPTGIETSYLGTLELTKKNILTWEIKICTGEEDLIDGLMEKAVEVHKELEKEFE